MSTPLAAFGPGIVIVTRTDSAVPISVNIGYAEEFSLDVSGTTKELFGQYQFPIAIARGTIKVTGKIKAATLSGLAWNATMFGQSFSTGRDSYYFSEPHTPTGTTQAVLNAAGGIVDLGVTYVSNSLPLQRVAAGSEAIGKYSVNVSTGVYTINAGDEVPLNFSYSNYSSSSSGQELNITNQLIGTNPTFQLDYFTELNQPTLKPWGVRLFSCVASKLTLAAKLEDFIMPEFDFTVGANASGQVLNYIFPEIS